MQRAAVLIVPPTFRINQLEQRLRAISEILVSSGDQEGELKVVLEGVPRSYVFVTLTTSLRSLAVESYADDDELDRDLRPLLPQYEFVVLLGNSLELLKSVARVALESATELGDAWFDDDHGHVLKAHVVLTRLESEPE